jgi:hypothetical protein
MALLCHGLGPTFVFVLRRDMLSVLSFANQLFAIPSQIFCNPISNRQRLRRDLLDTPLVQAQHAVTPPRKGKIMGRNKRGELVVAM